MLLVRFPWWRRLFAAARILATGDNGLYYDHIGGDLLEPEAAIPADSRWLNLGYWREAQTYPEAAAALARPLAAAAECGPGVHALDCCCGFAAQDFLWLREYAGMQITGVNITASQVEFARETAAAANLADRLELHQASATELPFESGSFDRVVSLESAFHYRPRTQFFAEASRVLRSGGRLAVLDMLPLPGSPTGGWFRRLARRYAGIPAENLVDRDRYAEQLAEAGFRDIRIESIREWVFPGFYRYALARRGGTSREMSITIPAEEVAASRGSEHWRDESGLNDYILATAIAPRK